MTTPEKCEAILKAIQAICDDPAYHESAVAVGFSRDWGPHSMTVVIAGQGHTHVGSFLDSATWEGLVDSLHGTLCESHGLSFAGGDQ
jgi:hypothetical protein